MSKSRVSKSQAPLWRTFALFSVLVGLGVFFYFTRIKKEEVPLLPKMEKPSTASREVGAHHAGRQKGKIYFRHATPDDDSFENWATPPSGPHQGWDIFQPDSKVTLRTLFYLEPGAGVEVTTQSGWFVALNGEGQMLYDEVLEDETQKNTLSVWKIKGGAFRARGYSGDPKLGFPKKFMKVLTAKSTVVVSEGEIGMMVGAGGVGSVWLSKGNATLIRSDGIKIKLIPQKKVDL